MYRRNAPDPDRHQVSPLSPAAGVSLEAKIGTFLGSDGWMVARRVARSKDAFQRSQATVCLQGPSNAWPPYMLASKETTEYGCGALSRLLGRYADSPRKVLTVMTGILSATRAVPCCRVE